MKNPFYKKWWFWVIIVIAGIIGIVNKDDAPTEQAAPAPTEEVQSVAVEPTTEPTIAPTAIPTETPTPEPASEPVKQEQTTSTVWTEEIKTIAKSDSSPTEKADAVEALAREYKPQNEELLDFFIYMTGELENKKYLAQIDNDEYMLTNIFESVLVEKYAQNEYLKDFAFDFYQNTKYTYRGADAVDSDSVISNEEQMKKSLSKIKVQ